MDATTGTRIRTLALPSGLPPLRLRCVDELPLSLGLLLVADDHEDWTGLKIWPGAHLLLAFLLLPLSSSSSLSTSAAALLQGRRAIVELGCGTGAVGLALAPRLDMGATVVLTDGHPQLVKLAVENSALNYGEGSDGKTAPPTFVARRLLWGNGVEARAQVEAVRREVGGRADLVLAADCIYDAEVLQPLLWTASQLLLASPSPPPPPPPSQQPPPAAFVFSYCGRCLLSDAEFDRRLEATAKGVGLRLVSTACCVGDPELTGSLEAGMAAMLQEANARVFVLEPIAGACT